MTKLILDLKEVIETLSTYNVEHTRFPHNYLAEVGYDVPIIRGLALGDRRLILLDKEQNCEEMRETVIHELIHTVHYRRGDLRSRVEKIVQKETREIYKHLYGVYP